jgi:hypothetical protein
VPQYLRHASVRSRLLAEPDLECYTIRLPAQAFRSGTGKRSGALSTPHRRQPPQCRASRAPPQGQPRQLRETRERQCHGQNPLGVGPCFTLALSRAATPLLDPHYQASQLVWVAPSSTHHRPRPRLYTCSRVPASSGPMRGSPWLPRALNVRLDTALGPRGVSVPLARARHGLLPAGGPNPSAFSNQNFRGSTPSGSAPPVTFAPRLLISRSIDAAVTTRAARLDTGLAAHDYPGGTLTR